MTLWVGLRPRCSLTRAPLRREDRFCDRPLHRVLSCALDRSIPNGLARPTAMLLCALSDRSQTGSLGQPLVRGPPSPGSGRRTPTAPPAPGPTTRLPRSRPTTP